MRPEVLKTLQDASIQFGTTILSAGHLDGMVVVCATAEGKSIWTKSTPDAARNLAAMILRNADAAEGKAVAQ